MNDFPPELRQMLQMQLPSDLVQSSLPPSHATPASMPSIGTSTFVQPSTPSPLRPQQLGQTSQAAFNPFRALGERSAMEQLNLLRNPGGFQSSLHNLASGFNFQPFKPHMGMPNNPQMAYSLRLGNNRPLMNRNEAINSLYSHATNSAGQQFSATSQGQLSAAGLVNNLAVSPTSHSARARVRPVRPPRPTASLKSPAPSGSGTIQAPRPDLRSDLKLQKVLSQLKPEVQQMLVELLSKLKNKQISYDDFSRLTKPCLGDQHDTIIQAVAPQPLVPAMYQPFSNPSSGLLPPRLSMAQNNLVKVQPAQEPAPTLAPSHQTSQPQPALRPAAIPTPAQSDSRPFDTQATDFGLLTDVMSSVGVDLREESENILRGVHTTSASRTANVTEGGSNFTPPPPLLDPAALKLSIGAIASSHDLQDVSNEVYGYISLAVEERLRDLVEQMIKASLQRSRTQASFPTSPITESGRPLYRVAVSLDPKKQLQALERVDRCFARSFQLRLEGSQLDEDGEPRIKRTRARKDLSSGISSNLRNLSEDARKRNANQTTHMFTGGQRKAWMMASSVSTTPRVSSPLASTPPTTLALASRAPAAEKLSQTPPPNPARHLPTTSSTLVSKPAVPSSPSSPVATTTFPVEIKASPALQLFQLPPLRDWLNSVAHFLVQLGVPTLLNRGY
ncbi:hypothetical protein L0F63_002454 [Massospora cicadina]|nr:hypothetical protein L0F63_002454 [Massospora cicadina]